MLPECTVAQAVAVTAADVPAVETWEVNLAAKAAAQLAPSLVGKSRQDIQKELLICLHNERQYRLSVNLDHWRKHAPKFLKTAVYIWRQGDRKDAFLRNNRARALRVAFAITNDWHMAESAVSATDYEHMTGKVKEKYYFLALKRNARDLLRQVQRDREMFVSMEKAFGGTENARNEYLDEIEEEYSDGLDPLATQSDAMDPLEVILRRQGHAKLMGDLARAKKKVETDWRYRKVRRRKWWKQLLERDSKYGKKNGPKCPRHSIS